MARLTVAAFAVASAIGCGANPPPVQAPMQMPYDASRAASATDDVSSSSASSSASALPSYLRGKGLSVPYRDVATDSTRVHVRPDLMRIRFALRAVRAAASQALDVAQQASTAVAETFRKELGAQTSFRGLTPAEIVEQERALGVAVTVDGVIDVKLDVALDFWKRNALRLHAVDITKRVVGETNAQDATLSVRFEAPEPIVADPEAYRSALIKAWVERAKAFAEAAQSPVAPLSIVDCDVPGPVAQSAASMDDVELTLAIRCRIDTPQGLRMGTQQDAD